jgi:mRNA-degrading endonuclease RelE of RelBE toxin-antitoxin system
LGSQRYSVIVRRPAKAELEALKLFEQRRITDAIRANLVHGPARETRHMKNLGTIPTGFEYLPPLRELRVGDVRIFYDVNEQELVVYVRAIRSKAGGRTTEEITR